MADTPVMCAGMARFTCHDPHNIYDIIPCDLVGSAVIMSAVALAQVSHPLLNTAPLQSLECEFPAHVTATVAGRGDPYPQIVCGLQVVSVRYSGIQANCWRSGARRK